MSPVPPFVTSCHSVSPPSPSCHPVSPCAPIPPVPPTQVQQKQHRDTVAVYRSHLLQAAQVGLPDPAWGLWGVGAQFWVLGTQVGSREKPHSLLRRGSWTRASTPRCCGSCGPRRKRGRGIKLGNWDARVACVRFRVPFHVLIPRPHPNSSERGGGACVYPSPFPGNPPQTVGTPSPFLGSPCPYLSHSSTDSVPVGSALFPAPPAGLPPPPPQREFGAGADALQVGAVGWGPAQEDPGGNLGAPEAVRARLHDPGTGNGIRDGAMGRLDSPRCSPASCPCPHGVGSVSPHGGWQLSGE